MSGRIPHGEPFLWMLFGAGGVAAAFLAPAMVLAALLDGLGFLPASALSYDRLSDALSRFPVRLVMIAVLSLTLWKSAHRIYHGLHDLQLPQTRLAAALTYGVAILGSLVAIGAGLALRFGG